MKRSKQTVLFILSGLLVAFGQPAWINWLAPVVAVGGFALFWTFASRIESEKERFWIATIWFALVQAVQLSWMTSIEYQGLYILFVYAALSIGLGLQFGILTLFMYRVPMVATAALWTLMEWMRLFFLCGFSWNPVGLTLTATPFSIQAVSLFGVLGLSFWVILTNLACWKRRWKVAAILALCPYVFGAVFWNFHRPKILNSPQMSVVLVQTALLPSQKNYFPERRSDFVSPYEQWSRIITKLASVKEPIDLVVLPESAVPFTDAYPFYSAKKVTRIFEKEFGQSFDASARKISNKELVCSLGQVLKADVVVGMDTESKGSYFSSALFYSWKEESTRRYDKQILLPLAEYLPFQGLKTLTQLYGITDFFTHGKQTKVFRSKVPIAPSICYEETFGNLMRKGRKKGASLFVNVTNDNWYPNSRLPKQHFDLARLRAVENGIPMVRSCNAGMTSAVDCLGTLVAVLPAWDQMDVLFTKVPLYQMKTLYTLWGDAGIVTISIFLLSICCVINRKSLFLKSPIR